MMANNNDWDELVQQVARSHAAPQKLATPLSQPAQRRRAVVPNVLPPYMIKPAAPVQYGTDIRKWLAITILFAGVLTGGYFVYSKNTMAPTAPPAQTESALSNSAQPATGTTSVYSGGNGVVSTGIATQAVAVRYALESRLRPAGFLETLSAGQKIELRSVGDLKLPLDGKPLVAYALLYARLDEATEKRWRDAGLFKNEVVPNSFLRTVTLANPDSQSLLLDWHVEGILLKLPGRP